MFPLLGPSKSLSGSLSLSKERRDADRRRYFEIARGSALECAAIQDVLVVGKALDEAESQERKNELDRMAAMLGRQGGQEEGTCRIERAAARG
ncbi:MAG: four helix bundle protein [Lentisphaerae bacterium]|jgi:hypothetical protein|nr:four helix bundle protein [Lentisphaerota bacterium]